MGMKELIAGAFVSLGIVGFAQGKIFTQFRVEGVCSMCEERIEAVLDVPGVVVADWDLDSKELRVVYKPKKIREEDLHALLNSVGHDTSKRRASDDEYAGIHSCCRYRESSGCSEGLDSKQ